MLEAGEQPGSCGNGPRAADEDPKEVEADEEARVWRGGSGIGEPLPQAPSPWI